MRIQMVNLYVENITPISQNTVWKIIRKNKQDKKSKISSLCAVSRFNTQI